MHRILFALTAALVICSCSTAETYKYDYDKTVTVLNERFDRNQWSLNSTEECIMREPVKGTVKTYDYFHKQSPNTNVRIRIKAERIDSDNTKIDVEIDDFETALWPLFYERSYQRNFHDVFFARLKNNKWGALAYEPANYLERSDIRKSAGGAQDNAAFIPTTLPAFPETPVAPINNTVEPSFEDIPAMDFDN